MLKACAAKLGEPLQQIYNMSLHQGTVPSMWKTSCLVPVPKKPHSSQPADFRPVALMSHVMKTLERLLLQHLRPQVHHTQDPLQCAYQEKVGVEDAILYLLHKAHSHLDRGSGAVRIMFFYFSSAFNTIQPILLRDKLSGVGVDAHLVFWIGCIADGQETEYRGLVEDFVGWCRSNHLQLNTSKTKEVVVDFRRKIPHLQPISIEVSDVELVRSY